MSDFERYRDRAGVTYDEPTKRRSPGTFFADLGDRLARGFNSFDRPQPDEADWKPYDELDQPTAAVETVTPPEPSRKRFPTALHGYDRDAVEDYIDGLEHEIGQMAAKLSAQRSPTAAIEAELARVGEETSAILRVAHEQAAEITRRARIEADRCVQDAAANAVAMTADAKAKLRQLDSETDAVWAERVRLIEDVRNVATSLFSLAEDASDRFPEDDRGSSTESGTAKAPPSGAADHPMRSERKPGSAPEQKVAPEPNAASAPEQAAAPQPAAEPPQTAPPAGTPPPATAAAAAPRPVAPPSPVAAQPQVPPHSPIAAHDHRGGQVFPGGGPG
jgi:cell division septum initiation protein DivIVA